MKDIKFWVKFGLLLFIIGCFVFYKNNSDIDQILSIVLTGKAV